MNKRSMRHSFNRVVDAARKLECEDLHHKESHRHEKEYMCPAKYELDKHISIVHRYMEDNLK